MPAYSSVVLPLRSKSPSLSSGKALFPVVGQGSVSHATAIGLALSASPCGRSSPSHTPLKQRLPKGRRMIFVAALSREASVASESRRVVCHRLSPHRLQNRRRPSRGAPVANSLTAQTPVAVAPMSPTPAASALRWLSTIMGCSVAGSTATRVWCRGHRGANNCCALKPFVLITSLPHPVECLAICRFAAQLNVQRDGIMLPQARHWNMAEAPEKHYLYKGKLVRPITPMPQ